MENEKSNDALAAEKLEEVSNILKEISTLNGTSNPFLFIASAPVKDEENKRQMFAAVYGDGLDLLKTIIQVVSRDPNLKGLLTDALEVTRNPLASALFNSGQADKIMDEIRREGFDNVGDLNDDPSSSEPCNCPECTEARKNSVKNNPNIN